MTFVEVEHRRPNSQRPQSADSGDAENDLLANAGGFIATIQAMCDVAVGRRVLGAVGVEQVYRDASHLRLPEARVDVPSANPDDYLYPLSVGCASRLDRQVAGRALAILCMLYAVVIDALREVTLSIQQADRDEVGAVVAGGLAVVSG